MIQRKGGAEWTSDTRAEHWILSWMIFHPQNVWPWAHGVSSQNHVSQMRIRVMSPALRVSQGWWDPIRGSMGTRKLSGRMNVPFRPAGIRLSGSVGSCSSIPHFRWLVLQPGSQEGGWIACSRAHTLIALEPAMQKKSWGVLLYVNSRWGASFAFYIKRLSWVRWVRFPNTPKQYPSIWSTFKSFGWFSSDLVRIHSLVS